MIESVRLRCRGSSPSRRSPPRLFAPVVAKESLQKDQRPSIIIANPSSVRMGDFHDVTKSSAVLGIDEYVQRIYK